MPSFRSLAEHELDQLSDDDLIAYIRAGREVGDGASARLALQILVYGYWDNVVRRVALKIPVTDVEDVAMEVVISAVRSAFDGSSTGEFRVWLKTITNRRIADYHRAREGQPAIRSLGDGDDDELGIELPVESHEGFVEVQDAIVQVMRGLSDLHRDVVQRSVFDGLPAAHVATAIDGMSEANVHQIVSRFRAALRRELGEERDTGGP